MTAEGTVREQPSAKLQLTVHGQQRVFNHVQHCKRQVADAEVELDKAIEQLRLAEQVQNCDHDLEVLGGIERSETRCKKCGYSWFD